MYSAPASFNALPVEKLFGAIKTQELDIAKKGARLYVTHFTNLCSFL